jgi:hypothetical protein
VLPSVRLDISNSNQVLSHQPITEPVVAAKPAASEPIEAAKTVVISSTTAIDDQPWVNSPIPTSDSRCEETGTDQTDTVQMSGALIEDDQLLTSQFNSHEVNDAMNISMDSAIDFPCSDESNCVANAIDNVKSIIDVSTEQDEGNFIWIIE